MRTYDESLKIYWDDYSLIQTAKHEDREKERFALAGRFKQKGVAIQVITETTGLTRKRIEKR